MTASPGDDWPLRARVAAHGASALLAAGEVDEAQAVVALFLKDAGAASIAPGAAAGLLIHALLVAAASSRSDPVDADGRRARNDRASPPRAGPQGGPTPEAPVVLVTASEVAAARSQVRRDAARGRPSDPAVVAIANARARRIRRSGE